MTEEMYTALLRMLKARAKYWTETKNTAIAYAYQSTVDMLMYAHDNDFNSLSQFDYYE